jgi:hypothetical protein
MLLQTFSNLVFLIKSRHAGLFHEVVYVYAGNDQKRNSTPGFPTAL